MYLHASRYKISLECDDDAFGSMNEKYVCGFFGFRVSPGVVGP